MYDVIVVGAGPAGNIAALRLSQKGFDVAVLDWRHKLGDKLCTGIIGRECFQTYRPDDQDVLHEARSVRIVAPSGNGYRMEKGEPEAYVIDRVAFIASLARRAAEAGASFLLGERVVDIRRAGSGVTVSTTGRKGGQVHDAKAIIIASGFGTPLLEMVGLRTSDPVGHMVACQAKVATDRLKETEVYLGSSIAPGSFGWLVPLSDSSALAGIVSRQKLNGHMGDFLSVLSKFGKVSSVIEQPRRWGIPIKPVPETYGDRVLVAGDAGGFAKPTTGGGIYYSLLSGEMAADVMGGAVKVDDFSSRRLQRYEGRWKAVFGREIRVGYFARRLYESLDDDQIERLVEGLASTDVQRDLISSSEFAFDWHSGVILKAFGHLGLATFMRSLGPIVAPFLPRLTGAVK